VFIVFIFCLVSFWQWICNALYDFKMYQNESKSIVGKNAIDAYLDEATTDDDKDSEDFDVLKYWRLKRKNFLYCL